MLRRIRDWFWYNLCGYEQRRILTQIIHGKEVDVLILNNNSEGWPYEWIIVSIKTNKILFRDSTSHKTRMAAMNNGIEAAIANGYKLRKERWSK